MFQTDTTPTPEATELQLAETNKKVDTVLTTTEEAEKTPSFEVQDSKNSKRSKRKTKASAHAKIVEAIKNEKPYKLHVFLDEHPLLGFGVFCGLFCFSFLLLIILAFSTTLIKFTSDVPMYMRDHITKEQEDALEAGYSDATWEKLNIKYEQQSVDAGISLRIVFTARNKKTLLTEKVLKKIEDIENKVLSLGGYKSYCQVIYDNDDKAIDCKRPSSITHFYDPDYFKGALNDSYDIYPTVSNYENYFLKSKISNSYETVTPDYSYLDNITKFWAEYGEGTINNSEAYGYGIYNGELLPSTFHYSQPVDGTLENSSLSNVFETLVDKKFGVAPTDTKAKALLSIFYFGIPLEGYENINDNDEVEEQIDEITQWLYDNLHDKLWKLRDKNKNLFDMTWKAGGIEWLYVDDLLISDMLLLFGTILTIWFYMVAAMGSWWLGNMGMLMIFMNFAPTILLYRYITQFKYFGTLNMLCLFIILSIGADDVFVLVDTWSQTRLKGRKIGRAKRLTYTLKHAGKVMATTSLSTIVSFIGNSTSAFPAIYTFGAFAAWLVFVNYCAVIFFYPSVLIMHDEYFYTSDLKYGFCVSKYFYNKNMLCKCCWTEGSKCYNVKSSLDKKQELKQRKIDKFFENRYYPKIRKYNKLILSLFLIIFLVFFYFATQLVPDPNPPQLLPDDDPYQKYNDDITNNFDSENSFQLTNKMVFGIEKINRKRTDPTIPEDVGKVKYTTLYLSFLEAQDQVWLQQFCDDLLCQYNSYDCRYRDKMQSLKITDPTNSYDINVRKCFMSEYRTWLLNDPDAAPNKTVIDITFEKYNLTNCFNLTRIYSCEWKIFPQADEECALFSFIYLWFEDELPTTNPDYTANSKNYDYWKPFMYFRETPRYVNLSGECLASGKITVAFFTLDLKLEAFADTDFNDGIKLWDAWDDYISAWKNNENGDISLDRYGEQFIEMPDDYRDLFFTDNTGAFSYFYVQRRIITESFTGIGISLLLALCILILATGNWTIALMSTFVIFMIVTCVMGFAVMLGWKLGMIESIIFIMVVGMAVDYVVHLSEAYLSVNAKSRGLRAKKMLGRIGSSILSGFLSTLLGIIWLVGSYLVSFYKFGLEIAFLEICSVSFGLIAFTAAVSAFGPQGDFGNAKKDVYVIKDCCYDICCSNRGMLFDEEEEELEDSLEDEIEYED